MDPGTVLQAYCLCSFCSQFEPEDPYPYILQPAEEVRLSLAQPQDLPHFFTLARLKVKSTVKLLEAKPQLKRTAQGQNQGKACFGLSL